MFCPRALSHALSFCRAWSVPPRRVLRLVHGFSVPQKTRRCSLLCVGLLLPPAATLLHQLFRLRSSLRNVRPGIAPYAHPQSGFPIRRSPAPAATSSSWRSPAEHFLPTFLPCVQA